MMGENEQPLYPPQQRKLADAARLHGAYEHYAAERAPQPMDRIAALEAHVAALTALIERLVIALEQRDLPDVGLLRFPPRALRFSR